MEAQVQAYQERLRALAADLTLTEDRERCRVATELHDGAVQTLASVRMRLDAAKKRAEIPEQAETLGEISQLLTNVVQHAHATKVAIVLRWVGDSLELTARDDGMACDLAEARLGGGGGIGLFAVRERMTDLGGALKVDSDPKKGFSATFIVRILPADDNALGREGCAAYPGRIGTSAHFSPRPSRS